MAAKLKVVKNDTISASWWRVMLVNLAFKWHMVRPEWSARAWRLSRFMATERTHMALAAYCSGVMVNKRLYGEYEDKPDPTKLYAVPSNEDVN